MKSPRCSAVLEADLSEFRSFLSILDVIFYRVKLTNADYTRLLMFRAGLRHFERWSAQQAEMAGLTPSIHQLLLAIKGHSFPDAPTIGELADYLLLRHNSVVSLTDRAEEGGLVVRRRSNHDHRVVRLHLTQKGERKIEALSKLHLEELKRLEFVLPNAWEGLRPTQRAHGFPGEPEQPD